MVNHSKSELDFTQASSCMVGGVNSPVRAFRNVNCKPVFYDHAKGSHVWDVDGNEYIDFIGSWGPMILGHGDQDVLAAVRAQLDKGVSFGAPCESEIKLAQKICEVVPNIDKVRMTSSGTEATMTAIRLARGYTGKDKIIKFEGNYHGHSDSLLVAAGSGVATQGIPDSPGVPESLAHQTIVAAYNDIQSVREAFMSFPGQIAAIIVEPVCGNMGVIAPQEGFLEELRVLCNQYEALLIFDEVITGFRLGLGGAQEYFGISADLVAFGKIIGAGFPVGCVAGQSHIMDHLAPEGSVYQAGTLSGNPIAMEAGYAQLCKLEQLSKEGLYETLFENACYLAANMKDACDTHSICACVNQFGSMLTLFFQEGPVVDWASASKSNKKCFSFYFKEMLERGFLIAPSPFEAMFISAAHTKDELDMFIEALYKTLRSF